MKPLPQPLLPLGRPPCWSRQSQLGNSIPCILPNLDLCQPTALTTVVQHDVPQYAHFLPKYFPMYGTRTMVNSSSICCNDSLHSLSASETYSSSSTEDAVGEDGRESISSASEELSGRSMKLSLLLMDMARPARMMSQAIGGVIGRSYGRLP
jgi:hypothetical protein